MASDPNANIQKDTVEARQGSSRPRLIYVLIAGIVLVVAGYFVIGALQPH